MSAVVCKCVVETNYIHDRDGKIIGKQLTEPKRFLSVPECPKCGKPYFAPATLADKALAERLARLLGGEHEAEADGDYDTADLDQACGHAFRARQLITLAEAQAMVEAERERWAGIADYAGVKQMPSDGSYSHHEPVMGPDVAAAIRATATGTKEVDE